MSALTEAEREMLARDWYDGDQHIQYGRPGAWEADHLERVAYQAAIERIAPVIERIIAARETALREEIVAAIEAKYLGADCGRQYDGRDSPDAALQNTFDEGLHTAVEIARQARP